MENYDINKVKIIWLGYDYQKNCGETYLFFHGLLQDSNYLGLYSW